jgi:hypothetical protein
MAAQYNENVTYRRLDQFYGSINSECGSRAGVALGRWFYGVKPACTLRVQQHLGMAAFGRPWHPTGA